MLAVVLAVTGTVLPLFADVLRERTVLPGNSAATATAATAAVYNAPSAAAALLR